MKHLFVLSILFISLSQGALSDKPLKDSPLNPGQGFKFRGWLGIEAGFGPNIQSGDLLVRCGSCLFDNGRASGYFVGLNYDHYFMENLSFGAMLSYEDMSFMAQYREMSSKSFENEESGRSVLLNVELQQRAVFRYQFTGLTPFLRYRPIEAFSIRGGLMMAFGEPTLTHTEEVANAVQLIQGQTYVIEKQGENIGLENNEVPEGVSAMGLYGFLAANGHFWVRYDLSLLVGLQWRQQIAAFGFNDSDFQILAPRVSIGLEYMFYRKK